MFYQAQLGLRYVALKDRLGVVAPRGGAAVSTDNAAAATDNGAAISDAVLPADRGDTPR